MYMLRLETDKLRYFFPLFLQNNHDWEKGSVARFAADYNKVFNEKRRLTIENSYSVEGTVWRRYTALDPSILLLSKERKSDDEPCAMRAKTRLSAKKILLTFKIFNLIILLQGNFTYWFYPLSTYGDFHSLL